MEKTMNLKSKIALALLATSSAAFAQTAPAAPESTLGYNVGVVSEYRYRGLGQGKGDPALQGGVDYAHSSGAYIGAWGSMISWIKDNGTPSAPIKGSYELDMYAGYKFEAAGVAYDVGYLRYEYLNNTLSKTADYANANTDEVYGAATLGAYTAKYSYSLGNLFGYKGSKGSTYLDLSATFDLGNGYSIVPHVGRQLVKGDAAKSGDYTDIALTLNKDFGNGLVGSVSAITVDAKDKSFYTNTTLSPNYYQGKDIIVVGVKYSF
jgi:uncharacterized protein (TIGR02001 family)